PVEPKAATDSSNTRCRFESTGPPFNRFGVWRRHRIVIRVPIGLECCGQYLHVRIPLIRACEHTERQTPGSHQRSIPAGRPRAKVYSVEKTTAAMPSRCVKLRAKR